MRKSVFQCYLMFSCLIFALLYSVRGDEAFIEFEPKLEGRDYCHLPAQITFTLYTGSEHIEVNLRRNDHVHPSVPSFTIREGASGSPEFHIDENRNEENQAFYQESIHEAALLVKCLLHPKRGSQYEMEGTIFVNSIKYRLLPSKTPLTHFQRLFHSEREKAYHILHAREAIPFDAETKAYFHEGTLDDIRLPPTRVKRAVNINQDIYIDVLVLLEYSIVKAWTDWAGGNVTKAKIKAKEYFALLMNSVNLRYKNIDDDAYTFNIRLVGFYISEEANTSRWSEDNLKLIGDLKRTIASDVLSSLKQWVNGTDSLPIRADHVMLFTSYDLLGTDNGFRFNLTTGLAYERSMCATDGSSVSIVEDHGGFQSVGTATHELGHSLGARHDGQNNNCNATDRFIMSPRSYNETEATIYHPWFFSNCSKSAFTEFISTADGERRSCLTAKMETGLDVPNKVNILPGQMFSPDEQCKHLYGNKSYLCRGIDFDVNTLICRAMFCYVPEKITCLLITAARGTTCGNKKWCIDGDCVGSDEAPEVSETCPHGDQPYIRLEDTESTCDKDVRERPYLCYKRSWNSTCCQSCDSICTGPSECACGDRSLQCQEIACPTYNTSVLHNCCKTCENYESTFVPTSTESTLKLTSRSPSQSTSSTSASVSTSTLAMTEECKDLAMISKRTCEEHIQDVGLHDCYKGTASKFCCRTCKKKEHPTRKDCKWGDQDLSTCTTLRYFLGRGICPNDQRILDYCCETCADLLDYFKNLEKNNEATVSPSSATVNSFNCKSFFLLILTIISTTKI